MVVEPDPVGNHSHGMLLALKAMSVRALLLQRPDDAFDHAVLLWAVGRDELLLESVALDQTRVAPAGEHSALSERRKKGSGTRPNIP